MNEDLVCKVILLLSNFMFMLFLLLLLIIATSRGKKLRDPVADAQ